MNNINKIILILSVVLFALFAGCSNNLDIQENSSVNVINSSNSISIIENKTKDDYNMSDFEEVLRTSIDYNDYIRDQNNAYGEFIPKISEKTHLSEEIISQRISKHNESNFGAMVRFYSNIDYNEDIWYLEITKENDNNRGFIVIIDMKNRQVIHFLAVIGIDG